MSSRAADWHLLFGLLALQNGLISREQLVSAFAKWTSDKSVSLDEVLVADSAFDQETCDTLKRMVELHVRHNGGNPQRSLMSLSGSDLPAAKEHLGQLDDSELHQSMAAIPDPDALATVPPSVGQATSSGGRFRILRPLPGAKGGMGEISVAKDEELGRQVALKQILSDKADHPGYRQKFNVEAEITGNLEHPGIVPIYGLGAGDDGRPYYAMRLVHGDNLSAKIKQFHEGAGKGNADYNSVEFHGLVDRLIDVAQAIRYAHSRGVLHRDLKPGNILVGEYGETLVIDWGLARLPQAEDAEAEEVTRHDGIDSKAPLNVRSGSHVDATMQGQALGTAGYAPPEQLNGRVDLITERSDVYALGGILYEVLVGHPPISIQGEGRNLGDLIKDTIAGKITPPCDTNRSIPKSLSAICMKALQREPADRYTSVEAFVGEIELWKADQPVTAAPDSLTDRVMRLARRYRAVALAAVVSLLGIAIVAGCAVVLVNRARVNEAAERSKAEALATEKVKLAEEKTKLAEKAEASRAAEELARKRSEDVLKIVTDSFRSVDPAAGSNADMTAKEVLVNAQRRMEDSEMDEKGRVVLLEALGYCFLKLGEYHSAVSLFEQAFELRKSQLGEEHPKTLTAINNLAATYHKAGQLEEALPLLEKAVELLRSKLGDEHRDTLHSMDNLGGVYLALGRVEEALSLRERVLKISKEKFGDQHHKTLTSMDNLARTYLSAGRQTEALPLYEQALKLSKQELGAEHPDTLYVMNNLAFTYRAIGQLEKALPLLEGALELRRSKLGSEHPDTLISMRNVAYVYNEVERYADAANVLQECLQIRERMFPEAWATSDTQSLYGESLLHLGNIDEAESLLVEGFEGLQHTFHQIPPLKRKKMLSKALERLVRLAEAQGDVEAKEKWTQELHALKDET